MSQTKILGLVFGLLVAAQGWLAPWGQGAVFTTRATGNWTADTSNTAGLGTWDVSSGSPVNFYPQSGDQAIFNSHNITVSTPQVFTGGGLTALQNPFVTLNSTMTMDGGTFNYAPVGAGNPVIAGTSGEWINQGTFNHTNTVILFFDTLNGNFRNQGTFNFSGNGVFRMRQNTPGTARFINTGLIESTSLGGKFDLQTVTHDVGITNKNTGTIRANNADLQINLQLLDEGGIIEATNGGAVRFATATMFGAHDTVASTTFTTTGAGSRIELGGLVAQFRGSIASGGDVRLGEDITPSQALSYIDLGSSSQITWQDAASQGADVNLTASRVLEFRSPVLFNSPILQTINGVGKLRNVFGNTFTMTSTADLYLRTGATFENNGTLIHSGNGGWRPDGISSGTSLFLNNGVYRATDGTRTYNAASGGGQTFSNLGTFEVITTSANATYTINTNTVLTQYNGTNTLTGGTWRIISTGSNAATLNLDPANAGISKIGAGATVVISRDSAGGTATFAELGTVDTVDGAYFAHGLASRGLAIATVITGTLGGNGQFVTSSGTVTFTGGALDPRNLAGAGGTLGITANVILGNTTNLNFSLAAPGAGGLNDLVNITGNLTLDGVLNVTQLSGFAPGVYRLFNVTGGSITDQGVTLSDPGFQIQILSGLGQVNLVYLDAIPEPSSLLLCGVCALLLKRRKRME